MPLVLKAFDVLLLLVEKNTGHIVEKDELMNRVWAGSFVEEGNLKVTVSMLRKALQDNGGPNRYIETVGRRAYRFIAPVKESASNRVNFMLHERTRETVTTQLEDKFNTLLYDRLSACRCRKPNHDRLTACRTMAGLGDRDQAFVWLERGYNDRHPSMTFLECEPYYDRVRSDPRFADLVRRVGLKT